MIFFHKDSFIFPSFYQHDEAERGKKNETHFVCGKMENLTIYVWILSAEFIIFMGVGRQDVMPDDKNI